MFFSTQKQCSGAQKTDGGETEATPCKHHHFGEVQGCFIN